jgi:hypothetical protein
MRALAVVAAPAVGGVASAQVDVGATTPPGTYSVTVTAANDDPSPQTVDCVLTVTVNDLPDPTPEPTPEPTPVPPDPAPTATTAAPCAMVNDLSASRGMAAAKVHLLTDRLERIDRFLASGQLAAAMAQLQALGNQALGLSPHWPSPDTAKALADATDALRAALAP